MAVVEKFRLTQLWMEGWAPPRAPEEPAPPPPSIIEVCRADMQDRFGMLSAANEATDGERIATDMLLRRCRNCGGCWMSRL